MTITAVAVIVAYWAPNHRAINQQVLKDGSPFSFKRGTKDVKKVDDYVRRVLFLSGGVEAPVRGVKFAESSPRGSDSPRDNANTTMTLLEWNREGGLWEDGFVNMSEGSKWGGLRAVNHFHDCLALNGGYSGIRTETGFEAKWRQSKSGQPYVDLLRPGASAYAWVEGGSAVENNEWGLPTVREGLRGYFAEVVPENRERALASAFRAIGQAQHLVEDNTVPDHARDLAHPGDGFEEYLGHRTREALFGTTPLPWAKLPLSRLESSGVRGFWDQEAYNGSVPSQAAGQLGIDEFVQANFLAWNRFTPPNIVHIPNILALPVPSLFENDILYFTTVPDRSGVGFAHMPWPKLTDPVGPSRDSFGSVPPALPLPRCIAKKSSERNLITNECWAGYATPLMKWAHGYAEAVWGLNLPPVRAEVIPDPGPMMDLDRFRLRVWNLGASAQGDAVTLYLDDVSLSSVRFEGEALGVVPVQTPGGEAVAPGAVWTSAPFTLTLREQGILKLSTYSAVLVKAHIGMQSQTPVSFGIPIPNGFPVVQQLTATTRLTNETSGSNTQSGCCMTTCTSCGENANYVQPILQDVTGTISRFTSQLDTLGRPADVELKRALDEDTRIAGVAVVAWGLVGASYNRPLKPMKTKLTLTDPGFVQVNGMWVRSSDAADAPDPDKVSFSIEFDARDFYGASGGSYTATQTVHLLVWMTSGAVYTQSLALWPIRQPKTVPQVLSGEECTDINGLRDMSYEAAGGCWSTRTGAPMCDQGTYTSTVRKVLFGPLRGLGTPDRDYFALYPSLELKRLGGVDVTSMSATCTPPTNLATSFAFRCFSDFNSLILEYQRTQGSGACPSIPPAPSLPREATMHPAWTAELKQLLKQMFGHDEEPSFQDVELR